MLRVVHDIIMQRYLTMLIELTCFFKKNWSFNKYLEKIAKIENRIENYNVTNVIMFSYKQENAL